MVASPAPAIDRLSRGMFLVAGDLILDHYIWGDISRISPEAPVPIFDSQTEAYMLGGAANVAAKIVELGGSTCLAGVVGDDQFGNELIQAAKQQGIVCDAVVMSKSRPTTVKTRYIAQEQQLLRVDREVRSAITDELGVQLVHQLGQHLRQCDGAVIADYAKGTLTREVLHALLARHGEIPIVVDPRGNDYSKYAGASVITPNHRELESAVGHAVTSAQEFDEAGQQLRKAAQAGAIAMKRGAAGISLADSTGTRHVSTRSIAVFDVTGAGDAVSAVYALALAGGFSYVEATHLANIAGGLVVQQHGVGHISRELMMQALEGGRSKLMTREQAADTVRILRAAGKKVVFTNGCFDLIHPGHVYLLDECRKYGDFLIVGLNSDESIQRIKGPSRPILRAAERIAVLSALESVGAVVVYDDELPLPLIKAVCPHVLVKGDEYAEEQISGARFVQSNGGTLVRIPMLGKTTTSEIVRRIQCSDGAATPLRRAWKDE